MTAKQKQAIRAALYAKFGKGNARIGADGTIRVFGTMPNTNQEGWYEFGHAGDQQTLNNLGLSA